MRWRLLAALLGVVAIMLVAQDVPLVSHLRRVERDRELTDLERDAFIIAGQAATALRLADDPAAADDAVSLQFDALVGSIENHTSVFDRDVVVVDSDGTVVASAGGDEIPAGADLSADADIAAALGLTPAAGDDDDVVSVAVPVLDGAAAVGAVRLSSPASVIDTRANRRARGLVWVAVISLGAAVVVGLLLSSTVTRPLRRLQRSTERVSSGDFDARVDESEGPAEIRQLARSFNAMTERIARSVEEQRSFAGDASHQLRTPLTALRLQLERTTALVGTDPDGALRNLEAAADEIARLQRMIDGLLLLSRSDDHDTTDLVAVRVDELVAERVAVWGPLAEEHGVEVTSWVAGPATATALPGAVEQIVDNYLDNAIAVAPEGTAVEVVVDVGTTRERPTSVTVHVLDRGPGLTDDQLAEAFRRFWRAPDNRHDGTGLGLAIVAQLAASSGGTVALERRPGGGIDAWVRLPAA
ncbi:sensor histidine kinase [Desertimonas flava]|uniref:sensor histidine kinase n=1 Tax=Desertimonas flava TaxID=2064846 RepID=UPI000E3430C3|nr:HAMP domain-containing sensor histidine kinase [Desertimonas flava]